MLRPVAAALALLLLTACSSMRFQEPLQPPAGFAGPRLEADRVVSFDGARLGHRHRAEACIPQQDPRGRQWWWIGAAGAEADAGAGTDFHAVRSGHIAITPIHVDLTRYQALEQVASWVDGLAASLDTDGAPHAARGSAA